MWPFAYNNSYAVTVTHDILMSQPVAFANNAAYLVWNMNANLHTINVNCLAADMKQQTENDGGIDAAEAVHLKASFNLVSASLNLACSTWSGTNGAYIFFLIMLTTSGTIYVAVSDTILQQSRVIFGASIAVFCSGFLVKMLGEGATITSGHEALPSLLHTLEIIEGAAKQDVHQKYTTERKIKRKTSSLLIVEETGSRSSVNKIANASPSPSVPVPVPGGTANADATE